MQGGIYLYFARAFLNTKLHIQCKRIQNLQEFFFLLICILMGKVLNKLSEFNYIYKTGVKPVYCLYIDYLTKYQFF